jgi:hypothetical protein
MAIQASYRSVALAGILASRHNANDCGARKIIELHDDWRPKMWEEKD